jgi:hypothetical protein
VEYLSGVDTMVVRAETRSMLLHVTGVMVLDAGSDRAVEVRDGIRQVVSARLSDPGAVTAGFAGAIDELLEAAARPDGARSSGR